MIFDYFGFNDTTKALSFNGNNDDREEEWGKGQLDKEEITSLRGIAARINFLSLDCPDSQLLVKQCTRETANPTRGSFKRIKKGS